MLGLGIIGWIIIGGLAGWIGSKIMKTDAQMGIILNIVVGIIGGLIGGYLLKVFGGRRRRWRPDLQLHHLHPRLMHPAVPGQARDRSQPRLIALALPDCRGVSRTL